MCKVKFSLLLRRKCTKAPFIEFLVTTYMFFQVLMFWFGLGCWVATFREILGRPYFLFVFWLFVILVVSRFGFRG